MRAAVGERDAGHAAILAVDPLQTRVEVHGGAPGFVRLGIELRDRGRDGAAHHPRQRLDDVHFLAEFAGDRRKLQPDEAGADDDDGLGGLEARVDGVGFGERAQVHDPVEVGAFERQQPVAGAKGEHQMVIRKRRAGGEMDARGRAVDSCHAVAEQEVDAAGFVEGVRPQHQPVGGHLAQEISLGERRALVGRRRLVADDGDRRLVALLAQGGGDLIAALPGADDDGPM